MHGPRPRSSGTRRNYSNERHQMNEELDSLGRRKAPPRPKPVHECMCGNHAWCNTTKGYVTLVSPQDAGLLKERSWCAAVRQSCVYVQSQINGKRAYLHRAILPNAVEVDHANHNGLDNRRSNIRECTRQENAANQRPRRTKITSKHKGVWRDTSVKAPRWVATITQNRKRKVLGYFKSEEAAAAAYAKEARRVFGRFTSV